MACFADINVPQSSVATLCKVRWDFKYLFNCKFTKESSTDFFKSVKIWQKYGHESVARSFGTPCILASWLIHGKTKSKRSSL